MNLTITRSFFYSIVLHAIAFGLLVINLNIISTPQQPSLYNSNIIDAVTINNEQIQQELLKIKELEQQKENEQLRKQRELERQLSELEKKSSAEEQRLAELRKKQQDEENLRKQEEIKLAEVKQQQETIRKQQEEQIKLNEEAKRQKQEELKLAEEDRKRLDAEEALKAQLAEEQRQLQETQNRQDLNVINSYQGRIRNAIVREFNIVGLPTDTGLSCIFQIRMIPGGDVVEARILKTSGNLLFDSRAEIAVKRASPLPVPNDPRIFAKMREFRLIFDPFQ